MTGIAKTWDGQLGDLVLDGASFADDGDLDAALINSLFTDRRAEPDDPLPAGVESRRGWWGDTLAIADGNDRIGSRLWLISREKVLLKPLHHLVSTRRLHCSQFANRPGRQPLVS